MPLINPVGLQSFNEVPDKLPPLPAAIYLLEITKQEDGQVQGKPVTNLTYRVAGGINGAESPQIGKIGRHTLFHPNQADTPSQIERARVNIKQCFLAFGVEAEPSGGYDPAKLVGRKGHAETFIKQDGGNEYANIKMFLRTDGSKF